MWMIFFNERTLIDLGKRNVLATSSPVFVCVCLSHTPALLLILPPVFIFISFSCSCLSLLLSTFPTLACKHTQVPPPLSLSVELVSVHSLPLFLSISLALCLSLPLLPQIGSLTYPSTLLSRLIPLAFSIPHLLKLTFFNCNVPLPPCPPPPPNPCHPIIISLQERL